MYRRKVSASATADWKIACIAFSIKADTVFRNGESAANNRKLRRICVLKFIY